MTEWLPVAVLGGVLGSLITMLLLGASDCIAHAWAAHCEEREMRSAHRVATQSFGWVERVEPGATWGGGG